MKKKILASVLCLAMVVSMGTTVFAADTTTADESTGKANVSTTLDTTALVFDITVPMYLGITVDSDGIVYTADNFTIENKSGGQIVVDSITVSTSDTDWSLVDWGTNFAEKSVGLKEFTLCLMADGDTDTSGDEVIATDDDYYGTVSLDDSAWAPLNAFDGELTLSYTADVSSQSEEMTDVEIATIEFTFDWNIE